MSQRFVCADREQAFLMPPSLREWLPEGHLAWFVLDAVAELDLAEFYADYRADGHGRPAHDPALMVALVLYAFSVGERSTRKIERRCVEDIAFRVITGNLAPDHSTIARFVVRHQGPLERLFAQVLALCARAGLVRAGTVALDSTKIAADASNLANRTYEQIAREIFEQAREVNAAEDELLGEARGDELPAELADPKSRRARLRAAKAELEAEWEAERRAREQLLERRAAHEARTGRRAPGRPPVQRDMSGDPPGCRNLTDPDSRPVKTPRGFIQGYNAHAVIGDDQIVLAAQLTNTTNERGMLEPMIAAARERLKAASARELPQVIVADAGYWSAAQVDRLSAPGVTVLVPPDGHGRTAPPAPNRRGPTAQRMRELLATEQARKHYRRRQAIAEPVFGHTKHNRGIARFRRRGLPACRAEWWLVCTTHNLLKLFTAHTATQTA